MVTKGDRLYIHAGKYSGHHGWYNLDRPSTNSSHFVIFLMKDGSEKSVSARRTSVGPGRAVPTTFAESILLDHNDIDKEMSTICRKLAQCELTIEDLEDLKDAFAIRLADAMQERLTTGRLRLRRPVFFNRETGIYEG